MRALAVEGCAAYRKKNAGKPLDEYDPGRMIHVTERIESFDGGGDLIDGPATRELRCPFPGEKDPVPL